MKLISFFLFIIFTTLGNFIFSQEILVLGKNLNLGDSSSQFEFEFQDSLIKEDLNRFDAIFIFSTSCSNITNDELNLIVEYVNQGGNIYLGAENYPFFAESNAVLQKMYNLQFYGNFKTDTLEFSAVSNISNKEKCLYETGFSTVSIPLDYRLKVEAWSNDNPIILSGNYGKGKILIDGGYSRFYKLKQHKKMFEEILQYFFKEE